MIRIVVDSASDYGFLEIQQRNMTMVPLGITIDEKPYTEGPDAKRDSFYEMLEETGAFPKTSQPSPQDFLDIFEEAKEAGDEVVCILLSSVLSGTYQSATLAKAMAEYDKIYLIDSHSATFAIKVMAEYACKLRAEGETGAAIAEAVEAMKSRVSVMAAIDTLEYLYRGGRMSRTTAAVGNLANIKPVITLTEDGEITVLAKCLGKNKAIGMMKKQLEDFPMDENFPLYSIYTYDTENCDRFEAKLEADGFVPKDRLQVGSVIGSHIGPGAFGMVYVRKDS